MTNHCQEQDFTRASAPIKMASEKSDISSVVRIDIYYSFPFIKRVPYEEYCESCLFAPDQDRSRKEIDEEIFNY